MDTCALLAGLPGRFRLSFLMVLALVSPRACDDGTPHSFPFPTSEATLSALAWLLLSGLALLELHAALSWFEMQEIVHEGLRGPRAR